MARCVRPWVFVIGVGLLLGLAGCSAFKRRERPAWRGQAEAICLAEKRVSASGFIVPARAIEGPDICGLDHPFHVTALLDGTVKLNASQTIGCPLTAALEQWLTQSVQPVAQARFGVPVVQINSMGSFSCRPIDNQRGERYSEHAFGNATDVGGFVLADGRDISVVKGWKGPDPQVQAFLREVQAGACQIFTTVLAPGSDSFHYNHIHLDLANHGNTSTGPRRYCKPVPAPQLLPIPQKRDTLPDPPDLDEELDVAQASPSASGTMGGGLSAGLSPLPVRPPYAVASVSPRALLPPAGASTGAAPLPLGLSRGAAMQPLPLHGGSIRSDGAFVPADMEPTSSIPRPPRRPPGR